MPTRRPLVLYDPHTADPEKVAVVGFLAGYGGRAPEVYVLDPRQSSPGAPTDSRACFEPTGATSSCTPVSSRSVPRPAPPWRIFQADRCPSSAPLTLDSRRRRPLTAVLVALGVTASGIAAAAWVLTRAEETIRIACPDDTFISAVSGDPVADCAREWRDRGAEPPPMTAYEDDHGRVVVVRDGDPVPQSWCRLTLASARTLEPSSSRSA